MSWVVFALRVLRKLESFEIVRKLIRWWKNVIKEIWEDEIYDEIVMKWNFEKFSKNLRINKLTKSPTAIETLSVELPAFFQCLVRILSHPG